MRSLFADLATGFGWRADSAAGVAKSGNLPIFRVALLANLTRDLARPTPLFLESGMPKASVKDQSRRELARRLGIKPDQLLTRPELAERLKTTVKALSVNLKTHPPFYSKGARYKAYYPLDWVKKHARGERVMESGTVLEGRQDWPPEPPSAPSDTEEFVRLLAGGDKSYGDDLLGVPRDDPEP